ncbi:MAG: hypothetical protein AAF357_01295 [Verrucomicrobiota bacterium]
MDYQYRIGSPRDDARLIRFYERDQILTHRKVHQLWQTDAEFSEIYSNALLEPQFGGFCWETPPLTTERLDADHECIVLASEAHQRIREDPTPFGEHFDSESLAVAFPNLGKSSIMIAPIPDSSFDGAPIATFLNSASSCRRNALWQLVGAKVSATVNRQPLWVSTAGLGVSWLHVRIDRKPKYYRYAPYREEP